MHLINISPIILIFMENEEALVLFLLNKTKNRRISFMTMQWNWMENNKTKCTQCVHTVHGYYTKQWIDLSAFYSTKNFQNRNCFKLNGFCLKSSCIFKWKCQMIFRIKFLHSRELYLEKHWLATGIGATKYVIESLYSAIRYGSSIFNW